MACSHCRRGQDKTVLSSPRRRCEHNWRRDKTVLSCRVGGVKTTVDKTRQFCLVRVGGQNSCRADKRTDGHTRTNTDKNNSLLRRFAGAQGN